MLCRPLPPVLVIVLVACLAYAMLAASACSVPGSRLSVPAPDRAEFQQSVYPVLQRDCGFPECHGSPKRFFRVFGPGRTRLSPETPLFADPTSDELTQSYDRARSMLANTGDISLSLLVRKPLDERGGGARHEGRDNWSRNVYLTSDAPGYQALLRWAASTLSEAP